MTPLLSAALLSSLLGLPHVLLSGSTLFLDTPLRLSTNSPFVETYFFWWTTLTYLPTFFFSLLLLITSVSGQVRKPLFALIGFFTLVLYAVEVSDFTILNLLDTETSYSSYGLNTLLTNSLNKYHPLVFYISAIVLSTTVLTATTTFRSSQPHDTALLLAASTTANWLTAITNLTALYMGSWWALEEGTWGGWWNWDSSEVFGLQITLSALYLNHSLTSVRSISSRSLQSFFVYGTVLISYFFIQLNFELVSHNFGSKFFFFFNNNLFFLEVILVSILLLLATLTTSKWLRSLQVDSTPFFSPVDTFGSVRVKAALPSLLLYWIFYSYKPLLNFFILNFININVLNSDGLLQPVNALLVLLLSTWLLRISQHSILTLVLLTLTLSNWFWIFIILIQTKTRSLPLHQALLAFAILNLSISNVTPSIWLAQTEYLPYAIKPFVNWENHLSWGLDSLAVNSTRSDVSVTGPTTSNWNLITGNNSLSINFFSLQLTHEISTNVYNLGNSYVTASLELELPLAPSLPLLLLLTLSALNRTLLFSPSQPF